MQLRRPGGSTSTTHTFGTDSSTHLVTRLPYLIRDESDDAVEQIEKDAVARHLRDDSGDDEPNLEKRVATLDGTATAAAHPSAQQVGHAARRPLVGFRHIGSFNHYHDWAPDLPGLLVYPVDYCFF